MVSVALRMNIGESTLVFALFPPLEVTGLDRTFVGNLKYACTVSELVVAGVRDLGFTFWRREPMIYTWNVHIDSLVESRKMFDTRRIFSNGTRS